MLTLKIVTLVFVVILAFWIVYTPDSKARPRTWERISSSVAVVVWAALGIVWGVKLLLEMGLPQSVLTAAIYGISLSVISALLIVAAIMGVIFAWMIVVSIFFPTHYAKFMGQDDEEKQQDKAQ